jgi:uncharacterized protein (DUF924 family)
MHTTNPKTVLTFWFEEIAPKQWWSKSDDFDKLIRDRFGALHTAAARGERYHWRETALGRVAEIIVLDQFSRNMFRNTAQMFASDAMALTLAQTAVAAQADHELDAVHRGFLYMPFMHSESATIHQNAAPLFEAPGMENFLKSHRQHKAIIDRFGRYPHRNALLGRDPTPEELAFLETPGSSF